jgi:hypothetical protein
MSTDLPIACSLSAAELPARLAEMASIGRTALIEAESSGRRALLRFHATPPVRDRLAAVVEAESACCAFLTMSLREEPGAISLAIEGPDGSAPIVGDLVRAFSGAQPVAGATG